MFVTVLLLRMMMMFMEAPMTLGLTIRLSLLIKSRGNPLFLLFSCFLLDHCFCFFHTSFSPVTWEGSWLKPMAFWLLGLSPSSQAFMRHELHIMHGEVQKDTVLPPFRTTRVLLPSNFQIMLAVRGTVM